MTRQKVALIQKVKHHTIKYPPQHQQQHTQQHKHNSGLPLRLLSITLHITSLTMSTPMPFTTLCRRCLTRSLRQPSIRFASTTTTSSSPINLANSPSPPPDNAASSPRWSRHPNALRAPHRIRPKSDADTWTVNEDPLALDEFYVRFLGAEGDKLLPEDVKWLAVTHKSFDQGRSGFNERLAFLGRRIVEVQASLGLLDAPRSKGSRSLGGEPDRWGRVPFVHPQTEGVLGVTGEAREKVLERKRVAQLAGRYGVEGIVRWKPRMVRYNYTLLSFALIGVWHSTS